MKYTTLLITALSVTLSLNSGFAELVTSFKGALPEDPNWKMGTLPVEVIEHEGKKVINFNDDSTEAAANLTYKINPAVADQMRHEGFTSELSLGRVESMGGTGAFLLIIRLPNMNPVMLTLWENSQKKVSGSMWNENEGKLISFAVPSTEEFSAIKIIFKPSESSDSVVGTVECFVDGELLCKVPASLPEKASGGGSVIQFGDTRVERVSAALVESFSISTP
jgi:hypothetical protein